MLIGTAAHPFIQVLKSESKVKTYVISILEKTILIFESVLFHFSLFRMVYGVQLPAKVK